MPYHVDVVSCLLPPEEGECAEAFAFTFLNNAFVSYVVICGLFCAVRLNWSIPRRLSNFPVSEWPELGQHEWFIPAELD